MSCAIDSDITEVVEGTDWMDGVFDCRLQDLKILLRDQFDRPSAFALWFR